MLWRSAIPTLLSLFLLFNLGYSQTASQPPIVLIRSVAFDSASELPDAPVRQVETLLVGRSFEKSALQGEANMRVHDAFQQNGYYKAQIGVPEVNSAGADPDHEYVALTFRAQAGLQYRLSDLSVVNAKAFAPEQLRSLVPLQRGEIFNTATIRKGLENLRRFYGCEGYANFIVVPNERIDDVSRTISLMLDVDEGRRLSLGTVEVWGLDETAAQNLLKELTGLGLQLGSVYSACVMDRVEQELRSRSRTVKVGTKLNGSRAQITIDFTPDLKSTSKR